MTRSVSEVNSTLFTIRAMPYGVARSTAAAAEVERVMAEGPDGARAFSLFTLIESYVWGSEVTKAYLPFTHLLRWWDEHPEHFDNDDAQSMFWSFKWMVSHLMEFPTVPAEQIERTLDDMERRYALAGNGMNAVALERFLWERDRGTVQTEPAYQTWVATPRDEFSQCVACEPGDRAAYLFETDRYEEGIRLLEQALAGSETCATEPGDSLSYLQLAYLQVGEAEKAARAHRRAVQHLATGVTMIRARGRHLEFLARSGNTTRALLLLEQHQQDLVDADTPYDRWSFLSSVATTTGVLLSEHADHPLTLKGVPARTVAELDRWARDEALGLAQAFDRRNSSNHFEARTRGAWTRPDHRLAVDLSVLTSAAAAAASALAAGVSASPTGSTSSPVSGTHAGEDGLAPQATDLERPQGADALIAQAEKLGRGDAAEAVRLQLQAADLLETQGFLDRAGFALAEAAQLAAQEQDLDGALATFPRALSLLWAGGVPPVFIGQVARAYARLTASAGTPRSGISAVERVLSGLDGGGAVAELGREQRELRDTLARLLAAAGDHALASKTAEAVAEDYARAGDVTDAAFAFWLAGAARAAAGEAEQAVDAFESAMEGFEIVHDRSSRASVGNELVTILRELGRDGDATNVAASLTS